MKKVRYIQRALLPATFVATIFLITSCSSNQQQSEDNRDVVGERNDEVFGNNELNDNEEGQDAEFLITAAEINMEEIQLGKLAQQKGQTADVKELGKMMEDAHTKSLNELRALAERKMISIPTTSTDDAQEAYNELDEESGSDFDKAYVDKMVSEHKDAISTFEDATTDSDDADIRNWAEASLPGLRTHLDHSINSQNKLISYNSSN